MATLADYLCADAPRFCSYYAHTPREFAAHAASTIVRRLKPAAIELKRNLEQAINAALQHETRLITDKLQEELRLAQSEESFALYAELGHLWLAVGEQRFTAHRHTPPPKPLALALFAQLNLAAGLHQHVLSGDQLTATLLPAALGADEANALQHRLRELNGVLQRLRGLQIRDMFQPLLSVPSSIQLTTVSVG